MRVIGVPSKLPLTLMTMSCIVISAMYIMKIGMSIFCPHDFHNHVLQKSSRSDSHDTAQSNNRSSQDKRVSPKHQKENVQEKQQTREKKEQSPVLSEESEPENMHISTTESSSHYRAAKPDDVLSNVSFADLMHVIEINSLNASAFMKWTNAHMNRGHKNAFQEPVWVHKGDRACDDDTEMVIVMPAVPGHVFMRELIRQTWASSLYGMRFPQIRPSSLRTKVVFLVGTSGLSGVTKMALKREALLYKDVVAADFVDSYRNLSLKMIVGLNWASKFCSSAKYVMKADLDTFVNIPLLSKFLLEISQKVPRFILGHRHTWPKHPVLRVGKWAVDREDYPFDSFPPYLLGHSYVMTSKLVSLIVSAGKHLPLIPTEDALITGVLARIIHAPRLHYEGFASAFKKAISCNIVYNYEMTVTKMSFSRLVLMWRDVLTNLCSDSELPSRLDNVAEEPNSKSMKSSDKEGDGKKQPSNKMKKDIKEEKVGDYDTFNSNDNVLGLF